MQNLGLMIIGWALGVLTVIIASLLYRFRTLRQQERRARQGQPPTSDPARTWSLYRLCLQVGAPVALLSLSLGVVLFALGVSQARTLAARQAESDRAAEAFQYREIQAQVQAAERRSMETVGALATRIFEDAAQTAEAAQPEETPQATETRQAPTEVIPPTAGAPEPATVTPQLPTASPTRRPTRRPTNTPKPSETPLPKKPWRGKITGTAPNCDYTQLEGLALNSAGGVLGNVSIHYWTDGWEGAWALSAPGESPSGIGGAIARNWDGFIMDRPRGGTWYVCVVPEQGSWDCISDQLTVTTTSSPCAPGSAGVQIVRIEFQQN
jgi:hypothetical protein